MEITMLIFTIISTIATVGSFIIAICVKKDTKEIKNNVTFNVDKNEGIVSNNIKGDINLHE